MTSAQVVNGEHGDQVAVTDVLQIMAAEVHQCKVNYNWTRPQRHGGKRL